MAQKCNQWDRIYTDRCLFSDKAFIEKYKEEQYLQVGDVIVNSTGGGTVGRTGYIEKYVFEKYTKFVADSHVTVVRTNKLVSSRYIYYYLISPFIQIGLEERCSGSTNQIELGTASIYNNIVPLPPYAEQKRIIKKIAEVIPVVNRFGEKQEFLEKLNQGLKPSLHKSILQEAIQGRLVPQDPNDEPASALLDKIQAEKVRLVKKGILKKKDSQTSIIYKDDDNKYYERIGKSIVCIDNEIPFEIPNTWSWVHLPAIGISELGKTMDKGKNRGSLLPYLCSINVYWNKIDLAKVKEALFNEQEVNKYLLHKGDLLICEGGDVGRSAIWNSDKEMYFQNALHRVTLYGDISPYYILIVLQCYKGIGMLDRHSKGMTIKHFTQNALHSIYLPLPPIDEQRRIVDKVQSITAMLQ